MTVKFDVATFANILPKKKHKITQELVPMADYIGIVDNEHCWAIKMGEGKLRILIRSSINAKTGFSDGSGENSIRLIVQRSRGDRWFSIGKGPDAFTQRVPGWEKRLKEKIKIVYKNWSQISQSFTDEESVFVSKKEGSKGRVFASKEGGGFRWLN